MRRNTRSAGFSLLEAIIVVAITLVATTLGIPKFLQFINNYKINDSARRLQSLVTLAHVKAAARNTRYRINTSGTTYTLQYCTDTTRTNPCPTASWATDATSNAQNLPGGVTFSTSGLSAAPDAVASGTVTQATEMTFNTRGLLFDESANAPADNRCFYLAGNSTKPMAVCTILTGRTMVYLYSGSAWQQL